MDIIDFFDSTEVELPASWTETNDSFINFVNKRFTDYIKKIHELDINDTLAQELIPNIDLINELCKTLLDILTLYFNGKHYDAYYMLSKYLDANSNLLDQLQSNDLKPNQLSFYRLRNSDSPIYTRDKIFHINFKDRHLISSYRYSIPGLPCLYLGGSSYICWIELGRPNFSDVYISMYKCQNSTKLLDFGYRPAYIAAFIKDDPDHMKLKDWIIANAILWPLIFSCSIVKKYPDAKFHHEYIIPQLMLEWVRNNRDVVGIRYFSTNVNEYCNPINIVSNFAFPVKNVSDSGFCSNLLSLFMLTEPINMDLLSKSELELEEKSQNHNATIYLTKSRESKYRFTEFYKVENKLMTFKLQKADFREQ